MVPWSILGSVKIEFAVNNPNIYRRSRVIIIINNSIIIFLYFCYFFSLLLQLLSINVFTIMIIYKL